MKELILFILLFSNFSSAYADEWKAVSKNELPTLRSGLLQEIGKISVRCVDDDGKAVSQETYKVTALYPVQWGKKAWISKNAARFYNPDELINVHEFHGRAVEDDSSSTTVITLSADHSSIIKIESYWKSSGQETVVTTDESDLLNPKTASTDQSYSHSYHYTCRVVR